jgi:hypothetical protein
MARICNANHKLTFDLNIILFTVNETSDPDLVYAAFFVPIELDRTRSKFLHGTFTPKGEFRRN